MSCSRNEQIAGNKDIKKQNKIIKKISKSCSQDVIKGISGKLHLRENSIVVEGSYSSKYWRCQRQIFL